MWGMVTKFLVFCLQVELYIGRNVCHGTREIIPGDDDDEREVMQWQGWCCPPCRLRLIWHFPLLATLAGDGGVVSTVATRGASLSVGPVVHGQLPIRRTRGHQRQSSSIQDVLHITWLSSVLMTSPQSVILSSHVWPGTGQTVCRERKRERRIRRM